jgi:hypothetical protein
VETRAVVGPVGKPLYGLGDSAHRRHEPHRPHTVMHGQVRPVRSIEVIG